jgi:Homocysteine/selenocysteine methylase (S-methylmethionine-dependent)
LIAGSIGPYGAYLANGSEYTGDYDLTQEEYIKFHYPRMKLLFDAGVDLFAFETQPNFKETKALVRLLTDKFPDKTAWLTFSVNDKHQLCDTTPLREAISEFEDTKQIEGIGVNCTSMDNIDDLVKLIRPLTNKPLIVYPNNGDVYDPISKSWQKSPLTKKFADLVPKWIDDGADVIGGCCRTTPEDIAEIVSFK